MPNGLYRQHRRYRTKVNARLDIFNFNLNQPNALSNAQPRLEFQDGLQRQESRISYRY